MTRFRTITVLLGAAVLGACTKNGVEPLGAPATGAQIKFYNFAVNAPAVNFYANDTKVTAISSTSCTPPTDPRCTSTGIESTSGTAYGFIGNGGIYSALPAGQYTFTGRIAATTNNGVAISTLASTLADGSYYSYFQSGIYNAATKQSDAFVLQDAFPTTIDLTSSSARFVNAISNSNPMTVYAKNTVTGDSVLIGSAVAYKAGSAFVTIPPAFYDVTARYAGSNTPVIVRTGVSFTGGHAFTVTAGGDMTATSSTATNAPFLDNTANR